jgi:hypothetical protein
VPARIKSGGPISSRSLDYETHPYRFGACRAVRASYAVLRAQGV